MTISTALQGAAQLCRNHLPAVVALLAALTFGALNAPVANAGPVGGGEYDVSVCANGDGTGTNNLFYSSGDYVANGGCYPGHGMSTSIPGNVGYWTSSGLVFAAPSGTYISGLAYSTYTGWQGTGFSVEAGAIAPAYQHLGGPGALQATFNGDSGWQRYSAYGLGVGAIRLVTMCQNGGGAPCSGNFATSYWSDIFVRLHDSYPPAFSAPTGAILTGGASPAVRSSQTVSWTASSPSGVERLRTLLDGRVLKDDEPYCDYHRPLPCAPASQAVTVDTTALSDGPHTLTREAWNAGSLSNSTTQTFIVDNHAPAAPSGLTVDQGEAWRSAPTYSLHWTNPSDAGSGIAKAYYQACDRADCQPVRSQAGAGISSLSNITVPHEGDWTVTVWLEDQAGNVSAANASGPVHLRYDATAPTQATNATVVGGGGWRATNSFDIGWDNPADQLAPITSVTYELCDSQRRCSTSTQNGADGLSTLSGLTVPGAGDYTLTLWVGDQAGNTSAATATAPLHLRFDNTDPGASEPALANRWINAADLTGGYDERITLTGGTPVSGLAGFAVTTDGSDPGTSANVGPDGNFHIADLPEGTVTIKSRAISNSGVASAQVGSAVLLVDNTAPTATVSGAPDPDRWQPSAVAVTLSGSDQPGLSGMAEATPVELGGYIAYQLDGGPVQKVGGPSTPVSVAGDGEHTITYTATDLAGNASAPQTLSFKIDSTRPGDAEIADPRAWLNAAQADVYDQHFALAPGGHDPLSGIAGYSITTDGTAPDDSPETSGDHMRLGPLPEGATVVKARVVSGSGLTSENAAALTLHVDRTPPEASVTGAPDPGTLQRGPVHLALSATDALSGMAAAPNGQPVTMGGYLAYTIDSQPEVRTAGGAAELDVTGNGRHTVTYYAVDAAGNRTGAKAVELELDSQKPGAAVPQGTNGWINASGAYRERIALDPGAQLPLSGISGYAVTTDGSTPGTTPDTGSDGLYTIASLPEGITTIKARAISGTGVPSDEIGTATLRVDRTAPTAAASGPSHADQWQRGPAEVTISGTDQPQLAGMTAAPSALPIGAGGYIGYRLDGVDTDVRGPSATIHLTADGQHTISYTATDAAGNRSSGGTISVSLDSTAPTVAFERPAESAPSALTADVSDAASGVASGVIEVKRFGTNDWVSLPSTLADGHLTARLTEALEGVTYDLRATATDNAGNRITVTRFADGSDATITYGAQPGGAGDVEVPFWHPAGGPHATELTVGVAGAHCTVAARHHRRTHRKRVLRDACGRIRRTTSPHQLARTRVRFGEAALLRGQLTDQQGAAIAGATLDVLTAPRGGRRFAKTGTATTGPDGSFSYTLSPGPTRAVRLSYSGTDTLGASSSQFSVVVMR